MGLFEYFSNKYQSTQKKKNNFVDNKKEQATQLIDSNKDFEKDIDNLVELLSIEFEKIKNTSENMVTLIYSLEPVFKSYGYGTAFYYVIQQLNKNLSVINITSIEKIRNLTKDSFKKLIRPLFDLKIANHNVTYNLYYSYNSKLIKKYHLNYKVECALQRTTIFGKKALSDKELSNLINQKENEINEEEERKIQETNEDIEGVCVRLKDIAIKYIKSVGSKNDFDSAVLIDKLKSEGLSGQMCSSLERVLDLYVRGRHFIATDWEDVSTENSKKKGIKTKLIEIIETQAKYRKYSIATVEAGKTNVCKAIIKSKKIDDHNDNQNRQDNDEVEEEENNDENQGNENGNENDNNKTFNEINNIQYSSFYDLKIQILKIWDNNDINLKDNDTKMDIYLDYGPFIGSTPLYILDENGNKPIVMAYALACGITNIDNDADLNEFIKTVQSDDGNGNVSGKYANQYKFFLSEIGKYYEECIREIAIQSLIARYEAAAAVAEGRSFYESDFINFAISTNEDQPQSGLKVASNIDNVSDKLNHYEFKSNRTEHEEAALQYTAFDITFKNTFNLTNPIIEKLGAQQVDLRDDLFKYGMYNQDTNTFNQSARDKYVAEKLEPIGLAPEEIEELGNAMTRLPVEVENNYYILSGKFVTVQDNFEKIAKIYALGEIIDNIRNLFKNNEIFSDNAKLGDVMGFEFDESEPADIVGDCLLLKGKVNGTETKIKYDLRTGKLYMNAMTQQEFNPPKITIGNDEPNTEIGNLGNFDDLLEGYQPTLFTQADKVDYSKPSNENATVDENGGLNKEEVNGSENKDSNQKTLERLMENKLLEKLTIIGNTVREKAGEQSKENNVIDEFLRTFNILPDEGNSDTIEFLGGSNLYILLESIKNTDNQQELTGFSIAMKQLMELCRFKWGANNLEPRENEFSSISIFDIVKDDVDNSKIPNEIISLWRAYQSFFSDNDGEKDRIKGCECHFDSSVKLSFANIIVQKCCRRYGEGWKISTNHAQEFVDSVKKGIEDIRHDESDVVAMENMIEDESMWN